MLPWWFLRNEILRRPGRAMLTLFSVVIGVATVLAISLSITTTRQALRDMYQTLAGRAALEVRTDAGDSFGSEVLKTLDRTPGVQAAVPILQQRTILYSHSQRFQLMVLGIDPKKETQARDYVFAEGRAFPGEDQVLLEQSFAADLGIRVGDKASLLTKRGVRRFEVVGLLAPRGAAAFQGGSILFMPLETAQYWFRAPDQVTAIQLVLQEGVQEDRVAEEAAKRLPKSLSVAPPAARTEMARETLFTSEQGLNMTATLSVVAAIFIVLNSFFMNLTERRRQLATLRSIGATRAQIVGEVLREGLILGVVGTALGIVAGIGCAVLLMRVMEHVYQTALPTVQVDVSSLLKAGVLGPVLSLVAVLLPAWTATRITPLEGMRPVPIDASDRRGRWTSWIAWSLSVGGIGGSVLLYKAIVPAEAAPLIVAASLVGMSLLIPLILVAIVGLLSWVLEQSRGANLFLACRQVLRQRTRSSLTAGVLFVAVVMSVGMGNSVLNSTEDIRQWVDRAIIGDFLVRTTVMFDLTSGESPALSAGILEEARRIPGIASVEPWTFTPGKAEGQLVMVVARTFPPDAPLSLDLYEGEPESVRRGLLDGEAVLSTVLARRLQKKLGDTITLSTKDGPRPVRIAGTVDDYIMNGTVMYLQSATADKLMGLRGISALLIRAVPERKAEVTAALQKLCQKNGLLLSSTADLARMIESLVSGFNAAMWGMLLVGFVVAAFGMVNTLTMNVLEQTRELGLLRVVGMSRGQVRKYVVGQAAVMGLVGLLPGAAMGELVAFIVNRVSDTVTGHPVEFSIRPEVIVGCVGFGLALTIIAALLPAARAARMLVGEAIQYE
jgi:putative ABC transport system permease protein